MTAQIDPKALPIAKILNKMTFGTVAGKYDPIARLFEIDQEAIEDRMRKKEAKPAAATGTGQAAAKRSQALEANRDTVRSRARAASVALASEDKDLLSSSKTKGVQGARAKLGSGSQ